MSISAKTASVTAQMGARPVAVQTGPNPHVPPIDPNVHKHTGVARIVKAGGYSLSGLKLAYRGEAAFRQECWLAGIALVAACVLTTEGLERAALIGVTLFVLIVELLNSAVEAVVDRVGLELHALSGQAKDMGSAAVLMSLLLWASVWFEVVRSVLLR